VIGTNQSRLWTSASIPTIGVLDPQAHGWVHRQVRDVVGECPRDIGTFVVDGELTAA
jgi:hypothetical protein